MWALLIVIMLKYHFMLFLVLFYSMWLKLVEAVEDVFIFSFKLKVPVQNNKRKIARQSLAS